LSSALAKRIEDRPLELKPPPTGTSRPRRSVRRELLFSVAVLFAGAVAVALMAVAVTLPFLESPAEGAILIAAIVAADLAVIFLFLRHILRRSVFEPLERIGEHAATIARGAYETRIPGGGGAELEELARNLNTMAERFIEDRETLAENVASLDRTNQDLVATTEEFVRAARMASIGTLAAGLAHEVGNPLGALMGYLDVARRRTGNGGDAAPLLDASLEEARRIDRIVRSVLEFAKEGGGEEGGPPTVPFSDVVDRAVELLEARRAMDAGEAARDVILEVSDNGPGIPEEVLPYVFDPFFTTKEPGKGTGVGLAITTRIVQELGGRVEAGNRPGGGARFTVRLPEAPEEA
jgi:two-component system, NtrC family, sensor kinase